MDNNRCPYEYAMQYNRCVYIMSVQTIQSHAGSSHIDTLHEAIIIDGNVCIRRLAHTVQLASDNSGKNVTSSTTVDDCNCIRILSVSR